MHLIDIYDKALNLSDLSFEEIRILYKYAPISELMFIAHELRQIHTQKTNKIGWIIDRNVNITNICIAQCKFCNFCRSAKADDSYITTIDEYKTKIDELYTLGGRQLLLQGGLHPKLDVDYYVELFKTLKTHYPDIILHALGPAEISHIAKISSLSVAETLKILNKAGLDSLPGAGAEILIDRVRNIVSPGKCSASEWLNVMREAHKLNLPTSATMMFGFVETIAERIQHLISLRDLQSEKPVGHYGFITFIPWPYQPTNTRLQKKYPDIQKVTSVEYLRLLAISRIVLNNIQNIQTSWLTAGKETGQLNLYGGANDFGSIMIEENVVSAAGAKHSMNSSEMLEAIRQAGFEPKQRNQKYEFI